MDCLEGMKQLPDNFVDLTITSPPYNAKAGGGQIRQNGKFYNQYSDDLTQEEYYNFIKLNIEQMIRVTKRYVFFNFQLLKGNKLAYLQLMSDFKENIKEIIIWDKPTHQPSIQPTCLSSAFEFIVVFTKKEQAINRSFEFCNFDNFVKGKIRSNVIKVDVAGNTSKDFDKHQKLNFATFTRDFVYYFIDNFAKENDIILDPFSGTGTVAYCAKLRGLDYVGFEIDSKQVDYSNKRLLQSRLV